MRAKRYSIDGKLDAKGLTVDEWAKKLGISPTLVRYRRDVGDRFDKPAVRGAKHLINGEWMTVSEVAEAYGLGREVARQRIVRGMDLSAPLFGSDPDDSAADYPVRIIRPAENTGAYQPQSWFSPILGVAA